MRFWKRKTEETAVQDPFKVVVTGSPPGVERGLYYDTSRGIWRDRDFEAGEATRIEHVEAEAKARRTEATDGFRRALPDFGKPGNCL